MRILQLSTKLVDHVGAAPRIVRFIVILLAAGALLLHAPQIAKAQTPNGFVAPAAGAVVRGRMTIVGVADDPDFRKWQLDLLLLGDPAQAFFVGVGDAAQPLPATLQTVDSAIFPDGDHLLRLRVVRSDQNYDEYFTPITIANLAPATTADRVGGLRAMSALRAAPVLTVLPIVKAPAAETVSPAEAVSPAETTLPVIRVPPAEVAAAAVPKLGMRSVAPPNGRKWIEVNLSDQTLTAWQGDEQFLNTRVSTGMPGHVTLPGAFAVYLKYEKAHMKGVDYDTPDVPWTMYYSGDFAVHGAYWHNDFGTPVSHGCVNLRVDEAKALYEWAPIGTEVVVHP